MDPEFDRRNAPKEEKDEFFDRVPGERPDEREDLFSPRPTRRQAWTRRLVSLVLALVLLAAGFSSAGSSAIMRSTRTCAPSCGRSM